MRFQNGHAFRNTRTKAVTLFGMSGVGKTTLANMLRGHEWYHYSVDYRIGTRYMGEHITENYKRIAMEIPFFRKLLKSDSIYISSNITFKNLAPLSSYMGKPGNPKEGGLALTEYIRRQRQHRRAEIEALRDVGDFIVKARQIYGYDHFVCDTGGSLCEVIDLDNPEDPALRALCDNTLLLYIRGAAAHKDTLVQRFCDDPKPMYYNEAFLLQTWQRYKDENAIHDDTAVDPDAFAVYGYDRLLRYRLPLYENLAARYGYTVDAAQLKSVFDADGFIDLIAAAIDAQNAGQTHANG